MLTITVKRKTKPDTIHTVFEVGDPVWFVEATSVAYAIGKFFFPKKGVVVRQEWWHEEALSPTYYDLMAPYGFKLKNKIHRHNLRRHKLGRDGSGNFHYDDLFSTEHQCIDQIIRFVSNDLKFFQSQMKRSSRDVYEIKKLSKMLSFWLQRLERMK